MLRVGTYYSINESGFSSSNWDFEYNPIFWYDTSNVDSMGNYYPHYAGTYITSFFQVLIRAALLLKK